MREFEVDLKYGNVDLELGKIFVYENALFPTNRDTTSQVPHAILPADDETNCSEV